MPITTLHTQVSNHAVELSEMFRLAMAKVPLGNYRAEMTAPAGSTAGGTRAMQHVRLVPREGNGHPLVAGNANVSTSSAELRTLEAIDDMCQERFKRPSGIDPVAYAAFLDEAEAVLQAFGLKVQRVGRKTPSIGTASLAPPPATSPLKIALLILCIFAVAAYSFIARR
jgi:hypothetical protein